MDALKSLVQPLVGGSSSSLIDGAKLVVLGGTVETARRVSSSAWSSFVNSFFLTAHFSEEDYPYDWLMLWLSKRPEWQRSREFETTTRTVTPGSSLANSFGDEDDETAGYQDDELIPGKNKTRVVFQPTFDTTHTIYYRGHWLRIRRSRKTDGSDEEMLSISVVARNNSVLKQLVLQAKREYEAEAIHRIQIYFADSHGSWRWTDSRHKRPLSSIVLDPGVKEMLLADTRDFLKSEKWYADRGIPFRRGYLLHGVPGSGKSSLIHAIAGELLLDIYVVSLSSSWMNDSTLTTLMGRVPARCILLLEDLDAAFTRSTTRDGASTGAPGGSGPKKKGEDDEESGSSSHRSRRKKDDSLSDVNTLSLSGLLNSLDGVAAAEGRILFATTNHLERLDPALSRPGRMDVWVEFKHASKWQAEALFRNFFPSTDEDGVVDDGDVTLESSSSSSTTPSSGSSLSSSAVSTPSTSTSASASPLAGTLGAKNQAYLPPPVDPSIAAPSHSAAPLDAGTLSKYAKQFADAVPENEFSVASLQGYLLKNKSRPEAAAEGAAAWVVSEREMRERLKREREARELKEKLDRERRRKELIEKEKKEKEEERKKEAEEKKKEAEEKKKEEKEERERAKQEAKEAREEKEREEKEKSDEEKKSDENDDEEEEEDRDTENDENASSSWVKADD